MAATDPAQWTDLFVAAAGAAAALTGLVFVAVSINIKAILDDGGLPERALVNLMLLLDVAIVALIGLVPGQAVRTLGAELLGNGAVMLIGWTWNLRAFLAGSDPSRPRYIGSHVATTLPGILPFLAGGASLLAGGGGGLYWVIGGIVAGLVAGVINAWVLLVEILR